ncbi:8-oxoguanine glycosylase ogg1 [Rhizophlyctis rosea]|nr:8-oxoguanine glycosylase ogg1 [Rhizophlyctis rosea]
MPVSENDVQFRTYDVPDGKEYEDDVRSILRDYFQLDVRLADLYKSWGDDVNFKKKAANLSGIRILRQDPAETTLTFICTSNNNIARITGMIASICSTYGTHIGTLPPTSSSSPPLKFYTFPTISSLTDPSVEAKLRQLGFGYRAKYIYQTARLIQESAGKEKAKSAEDWVSSFRDKTYEDCREALMQFSGVGPKVADCICLMAMDQKGAIPVDTHVWQIAKRDYGLKTLTSSKTLTPAHYKAIGDRFREIFGEYAGWAHSVLFTADLKQFESRVTTVKKEVKVSISKVTASDENTIVTETESSVAVQNEVTVKKRKRTANMVDPTVESLVTETAAASLDSIYRRVKLPRIAKRKRVESEDVEREGQRNGK